MLNSLNHNFNIYLKKRSNLQRLILSLNDSSDEVQQKTIIILKRLIPNNPSEIIPALQKVLYKLIRVINLKQIHNDKTTIRNLKLLRCYSKHAPFLIKNHKNLIFEFLINLIRNQDTTPVITAEIFCTLNYLITISREVTVTHFHELFHLLVESLQDMAFVRKRIEAAMCLINVIKTTGFVVYTNYRYPYFTELIYVLFQIEPNKDVKY